jgi:uncharacterized membrane protein YqiK
VPVWFLVVLLVVVAVAVLLAITMRSRYSPGGQNTTIVERRPQSDGQKTTVVESD